MKYTITCQHCGEQKELRGRPAAGDGKFCSRSCHYASRVGRTYPPRRDRRSMPDIFWSRVRKSDAEDACWGWSKKTYGFGYANFSYRVSGSDGRPKQIYISAHRASWEIHFGPVPDGLFVLHSCDNPSCTNPNHLFLGTQLDNMRDRHQKGRVGYIAKKLRPTDIPVIRSQISEGLSDARIAARFAVSGGAIWAIKKGRTWTHVS